MDPVTHITTGLLLSQLIPGPSRHLSALAGVILSLLPDLDYLLVYLDRLSFIRYHRGFTHSLVAVLLFSLLVAGLGQALGGPRWFRPLLILGLAVLGLHVLLDLATSYGTQIFSPISSRKYTLDWLFIIDPYLTALLAVGAVAALISPGWGRKVGAVCLALAGGYFLICGCYHQQAWKLARQVFQREAQAGATVAALPQPLSCRRWQLIAAAPGEIKQALVELPYLPQAARALAAKTAEVPVSFTNPHPRGLAVPYQPPWDLQILTWRPIPPPTLSYAPQARQVLDIYLDFARFPLLAWVEPQGEGLLLKWLDLRFAVPGRPFPFVLALQLDGQGQLRRWAIDHGGFSRK
jgi:inner membrane protein